MNLILLNLVWPALYVCQTLWHFWFLVIGTIVIELFTIKYFLKFSWIKSFFASFIGNCVSGLIGTVVMMWAMFFCLSLVDDFIPAFGIIDWVVTYVFMCLGSVMLETLTIKLIYKEKIKRLFLPMFIGNFLSYAFIAVVMLTSSDKDLNYDMEKAGIKEYEIKYLPNKRTFVLFDSSLLQIDTSTIKVFFDKNNRRLNDVRSRGYYLSIPVREKDLNELQFQFRSVDDKYTGRLDDTVEDSKESVHFTKFQDQYKIILEQRNPDTTYGWERPIIIDTLTFKRILK